MRHTRATRTRGASRGDSGLQRSSVKYPRAGPGTRSVSSVESSKVARCMSGDEPKRSQLRCGRNILPQHWRKKSAAKAYATGEPSSIYCQPTLNARPQQAIKGETPCLSHLETLPSAFHTMAMLTPLSHTFGSELK